ncbi:MAG: hypothetical protein ACI93D_000491 [Gammaproteobacteria bacterium]|jgi:hypothetical protein|tara:strand:- start:191 stop:331 length:141 start_codon:yes stop_codon:yes gene_type:complete
MIEKFIKTECGLSEYKRLKILSENKLFFKLKLYLYIVAATIRDFFK